MTTSSGTIVRVRRNPAGSGLAVDAHTGDTTLQVAWSIDFDTTGGILNLDGNHLIYLTVDDITDTITLATALTADSEAGTPVAALDATGNQSEEWLVDVDLGDGGEVPAVPDHALTALLQEGDVLTGLHINVESDGNGYIARSMPDKAPSVSPNTVVNPLYVGVLTSPVSITSGLVYQTVTGWFSAIQRGGITYDPSTGKVRVPMDGYYAVSSSAAMFDSSSSTGRRAARPLFSTYIGDIAGGENNQDGVARRHTVPLVSPLKGLQEGEFVSFQVSQSSGAAMDLFGDSDGNSTFFCVEYRGPLD